MAHQASSPQATVGRGLKELVHALLVESKKGCTQQKPGKNGGKPGKNGGKPGKNVGKTMKNVGKP
jgi:hypothetical protein